MVIFQLFWLFLMYMRVTCLMPSLKFLTKQTYSSSFTAFSIFSSLSVVYPPRKAVSVRSICKLFLFFPSFLSLRLAFSPARVHSLSFSLSFSTLCRSPVPFLFGDLFFFLSPGFLQFLLSVCLIPRVYSSLSFLLLHSRSIKKCPFPLLKPKTIQLRYLK